MKQKDQAKQNTKKELKERMNWTSSAENSGTGCTDAWASVLPVLLISVELVQFSVSLSSFFVFCFVWPFYFIPGIYKYLLGKLISPIDCVVTQSPKSQNNGLMGPFSLQSPPFGD